ncbi:SgrR family transcriptional regulator [Sesbania bispinosa]|nr:SgrR family transcriptional regulator [Sesbania bispinosa]
MAPKLDNVLLKLIAEMRREEKKERKRFPVALSREKLSIQLKFNVCKVIDEHLTKDKDVKRFDLVGSQSAHVMLQLYGSRMAFLGRYLELEGLKKEKQLDEYK